MPDPAGQVLVRPLRDDDVEAAWLVASDAFDVIDRAEGQTPQAPSPPMLALAHARVRHLLRTDPGGARVAEQDGRVVGVGLALRRDAVWFLSLLTVDPSAQGAGTGARLLQECLRTAEGATVPFLCASRDPRALRRYARAGFGLQPALRGVGKVDRTGLPAGLGVREGDWDRDAELVDAVATAQRGGTVLPEVDVWRDAGTRPLVLEEAGSRGYALVRANGSLAGLGATDEGTARRLLAAALAEAGPDAEVEVEFVTGANAWAFDVLLDARLDLLPGGSVCVGGRGGPMAPYLPTGAYG